MILQVAFQIYRKIRYLQFLLKINFMLKIHVAVLPLLLLFSFVASAQSFFEPLHKPVSRVYSINRFTTVPDSAVIISPTVAKLIALRPVFNAISYTIPDNVAQAGFGVSVQWLHYDNTKLAYYADLCINGLFYGGAQLGQTQQGVYAAGVSIGFLNNLLAPGADYNFVLKKPQLTLSANINFNNK